VNVVLSDNQAILFPFNSLRVIPYQQFNGIQNMALDLFYSIRVADLKIPLIRFYGWHPYCLSLGYHQDSGDIDLEKLASEGFDIVRRPTGGSAIFHAQELTYSIIIPRAIITHHQLYEFFHIALGRTLNHLGINVVLSSADYPGSYLNQGNNTFACFNRAAKSEIKFKDKKLVGSAQKIFENAILQHGSIIFGKKHEEIVSFLKVDEEEKNNQKNYLKGHAVSIREISTHDISSCMLAEKLIDEISISQKINNIFYRYTDSDELKSAESFYDKVIINK